MLDDVLILRSLSFTEDEHGNQIEEATERRVFCQVRNLTRSEFYQAAQTDLHPQYVFTISHFRDYLGEKEVKYTDWTGETKLYDVIRTYRVPDSDVVELTVQERIGDYGTVDSSPDGEDPGDIQPGSSGCGQCSC